MPTLAENRQSPETEKLVDALNFTRYPYPSRETNIWRSADAISSDRDFVAYTKIMRLNKQSLDLQQRVNAMANLRMNWDTYGAEPPNAETMRLAREFLVLMELREFLPTDVVASVEGGIALTFSTANRYADIEFLNSGGVLAVTVTGQDDPVVWEVEKNSSSYAQAVERIHAHIAA